MEAYELVDAVAQQVLRQIRKELGNVISPFLVATFVAAEGADANLSQVTLPGGGTARFVPKGAHVTGLVAGDSVLCVRGKSVPLTIVQKNVGDISLATA